MGLWGDLESAAGEFVDANAHLAGGLLNAVGLDDWGHQVEKWGDGIADDLGAGVGELNLGQTDDPKELVHGDVHALGDTVKHLQNFAAAFDNTAQGLGRMDSAHWQGKAAEGFRKKFGEHPVAWQITAEACTDAAKALDALSHTIDWAQGQAKQAIDLYHRAEQQTKDAKEQYRHQVDSYNHAADAYNNAVKSGQSPTPPIKPGAFTDPGADGRKQAAEMLLKARKERHQAALTAEAAIKAATAKAPKKAGFWSQLGMDLADAPQIAAVGYEHVQVGVVKGGADLLKFARGLNPEDPYNLTHPAQYFDHVNQVAAGLVQVRDHPMRLLSSLAGSGWGSDPSEAAGKLLFNVVSGAATGGGEAGAVAAERIGLDAVENAAKNEAVHTGESAAESAAADAAGHPVEAPHAPEPEPDRLAAAANRDVNMDGMAYKPVWREGTEPLYRFDNRPPDEIFSDGFHPWDDKMNNLMDYASTNRSSIYVGTTTDPNIALGESKGFRYDLDVDGGIDVNATLGKDSPYKEESEIVLPGGIKTEHIKGAWERMPDGSLGNYIPNPHYKPRITTPSAPDGLPPGWQLPNPR